MFNSYVDLPKGNGNHTHLIFAVSLPCKPPGGTRAQQKQSADPPRKLKGVEFREHDIWLLGIKKW